MCKGYYIMTPKLRIIPIVLLIVSSCVSHKTKAALDRAESLVNEAPDSALVIVKAIDRDELVKRTDLEEETVDAMIAAVKEELDINE